MKIPLSNAYIEKDDIEEVLNVLKSKRLALGPYMEKFENITKSYVKSKFAIAVSSGTAALHLILKSLNFKEKDTLLVPSFTFISSANVALYEKGKVHFVDIEGDTLNISPNALEEEIVKLKKTNNGKLFFMGVDIFGHPLDWDKIIKICEKHDVTIIEDSCEALGSEYKGKKCGTFGIAGTFAFYPNKQITTGEGGIIVTNDEKIARLAKAMRNQGRTSKKWLSHELLGYNYRLDEMSSALGYSQMKKIDKIIEMRNKIAQNYKKLLNFVETPTTKEYTTKMSWFVYVVKLPKEIDLNKVITFMKENGIETKNYFAPVHLQPLYKDLGWKEGMLPVTENISKRTLAIPFHSKLTLEKQEKVAFYLKKAIELFT
ncbi:MULTISPECIES: DegT/DnrJ/EryC1/StrS family aminotransferase [unclassified Thermosipho (in: thermotogales)]|uniref:DegT/DnrJ/EryC1/StrS family aminotransferase n=1 Tax=unclassified Thermosipho (in: thermotogales) TaxID=2676525 RepID=UPI0009493AE6|nr:MULTISPECIES: DegT/DnrJ/EryC1/StrS aminotransferase family protein [unclassified Thermosipho (in: thermotogales)]ANQ53106.1 polysaccharide biosynthesis protein [Thermosipho sp. 1070]OOC45631.1 polysaccharide biosynthesis protein [Thermosipho sp. 1074]